VNRRARYAAIIVAAVALVGACGGGSDGGNDRAEAPSELREVVDLRAQTTGNYPEVEVAVKDNDFVPPAIRINPGTTVKWVNQGRSAHDILPVDESQDFGEPFGATADEFEPGEEYEFFFDAPGVYLYYCSLHGTKHVGMIGMVVVGDVDPSDVVTATTEGGDQGGTLHVPDDYETIQAAVDAAKPGSLVLVAPGVYKEAVTVTTERIVIRGLDRARTILDGGFELDNGIKVLADGVAVENMTARNFTTNGFFWTGVRGYRGSYLTAIRNGDYGIYAFDSVDGQFDHAYGAGSPDAGFYIGQCFPCNALIIDSLAEWNGIGFSGTNAGGNLLIVRSEWRDNRIGIAPNSGTYEEDWPQHGATIVGNTVYGNSNDGTGAIDIAQLAIGNGILVGGGNDNLVERNLVYDHDIVGIGVIPLPEKLIDPDNPDARNFDARRNRVIGNVVRDSRAADLALVTSITDPKDAGRNCFSRNRASTSLPVGLQRLVPCDRAPSTAFETDLARFAELLTEEKPGPVDYREVALPPPPDLPDMPNAADAPARPAGAPRPVDIAAIPVPSAAP
jgi:plastocyanin